jgi:hypothetical protein
LIAVELQNLTCTPFPGHVEHHAETYDSMKLKTDDAKWMASPPAQRLNVGKTSTSSVKKTNH